jgi:hypothetical protein
MLKLRGSRVVLLSLVLVLALSSVADAVVLISGPRKRACRGGTIRAGYWYQEYSGGPRRVKIRFKNSRGDTLTVRRRATTRWKYVRLTPLHTGRYWTTFSGPKKGGGKWRATYVTRVRRC